jgi:hypothetical protein
MPELAAAPRVRSVDPRSYAPFARFSCGGDLKFEREVDEIVQGLYSGRYPIPYVRVADDDETGALIGVCGTGPREFPGDPDAAYVAIIGISAEFRGYRTPNGTRLGALLLADALQEIKTRGNAPPMPPVWALIDPANGASHNLFADFGFEFIPGTPGGYDIRYRNRGLGLTPA